MAASSTLEGVAALTAQLQALGKLEDGLALKRAVKAGIKPAYDHAVEIIPVGTRLHRSLSSKRLKAAGIHGYTVPPGFAKANLRTLSTVNSAKNVASGLLSVRKAAEYATKYLELGTRKMQAHPWLRRSLLESRDACEEALRANLLKSVLKAARTT
jgi:HK97 gp10 family phage protein